VAVAAIAMPLPKCNSSRNLGYFLGYRIMSIPQAYAPAHAQLGQSLAQSVWRKMFGGVCSTFGAKGLCSPAHVHAMASYQVGYQGNAKANNYF
jgi:hypothetical protein